MSKAYPDAPGVHDPARLAVLRDLGLLDSVEEAAFDRLTRLASRLLDAPISLISLVDDHRQFFKSAVGLKEPWATARETPLSHSFCQYTLQSEEPLVVPDTREHPMLRNSPSCTEESLLAYAGVPLKIDGAAVGTLCVVDTVPRGWTEAQLETLADLAASVTTEIELRRYIDRRRQVEAMKDEFMAVMSHELRTPLTSIRASLGLLGTGRLGELSDRGRQMLDLAVRNTDRLMRLINDIIDVERLESGSVTMELERVSLEDLIRGSFDTMGGLAEQRQVTLTSGATEGVVMADAGRMQQVLSNLLSNAVKFSPAGGTVHVESSSADGEVRISVSDEGRGIPPDRLELVFQRFQQVEAADATEKGGSGLGLPISRSIVEQHGGRLTAESDGSSGSTFHIVLPAADDC